MHLCRFRGSKTEGEPLLLPLLWLPLLFYSQLYTLIGWETALLQGPLRYQGPAPPLAAP